MATEIPTPTADSGGPGYKIAWQPQPGPQTALLSCPCDEIFFGGARGGGKTDAVLGEFAIHADQYRQRANGLMLRRSRTELKETIQRSLELYGKLGGVFNGTEKMWVMPGGGRLTFAYLDNAQDAQNYQGDSRTRVYVEEIGNFPDPDIVFKLRATLRSASDVPCKLISTGNPGGPGHGWIKDRYIDPAPLGWQPIKSMYKNPFTGKMVEKTRIYIPSRVTDNQFLGDDYIANLQMIGDDKLVRAWLMGDFSAIAGAYFDCFSHDAHVVAPFEIPANWTRFRAMDWGSYRPFAVGWFAVSDGMVAGIPKGALVLYREWYGGSGPNKGLKMTSEAVADGIAARQIKGERIAYSVCDPSMYIEDGGPSIAESMARKGIQFRAADNSRVAGWTEVRGRFIGEEKPMLYLFSTCTNTIRTLPILQHDDKKPEDIDTEGDDHCADMLRYGCMSRPWVRTLPPRREDIKGIESLTLNTLWEKEAQRRKRA